MPGYPNPQYTYQKTGKKKACAHCKGEGYVHTSQHESNCKSPCHRCKQGYIFELRQFDYATGQPTGKIIWSHSIYQ